MDASSAEKSKSCVNTTQPFARAQLINSASFALGLPTVDQCTAMKPWPSKNCTHDGEKFMSMSSFTG